MTQVILLITAPLRIFIEVISMTSRSSREEAPTTTKSFHPQPTASADEPPATLTITANQPIQRIVLEIRRHYDLSTAEENTFVQRLEDVVLFDLGMVLKNREEFKNVKAYLRECESMQRVLDDTTMISELEGLVYTVTL